MKLQKPNINLTPPDYHNGIGVSHAAQPQKDVAHNLAKEAYFMAMEYTRTIEELEKA